MPYSANKENILVVGPLSGDKNSTIVFPILSPNPEINKDSHYVKYEIQVGGNRGRGQVYPTGEKSNNNAINSLAQGKILSIRKNENTYLVEILTNDNKIETQKIPTAYKLIIQENQKINKDEALTENPNIGGFGQADVEIVLQNPKRIYAYLAFCIIIILTQAIFVFKKKQYEKVQLNEMDF
jgi:apocytochrome f